MNIQHRIACLILLVFVSLTSVAPVAVSQEVAEDERATCVFDIDVVRIRNSGTVQAIGFESILSIMEAEYILPPDIPIRELNRVNGVFEFSESWESIMNVGPMGGKIPMDFYIQLHFNSDEAMEVFKSDMGNNSSVHEHEGKTYYGPPEGGGEEELNLRIGFNDRVMEVGTTNYVYNPEKIVMTDSLKSAWEKIPADNIARGAIDLESSRELIDGFLAQLKDEFSLGDPTIKMLAETTLKVVDDVEIASGYFDLDNDKMLSLNFSSSSEEAAEKIEGVANGLLFMGALPLKNGINGIDFESKDDAKPLIQLVDQLKAKQNGTDVVMEIIKSEEYKETCESLYFPMLNEWAAMFKLRKDLEMVANAAVNYNYYCDGRLPFLKSEGAEWNENLSWRVRILEHSYESQYRTIGQMANSGEAWDHESNQQILEKMPSSLGPDGNKSNIVWVKTKVKKYEEVTDDHWSTIMLLRLPEPTEQPWTHPETDTISVIKVLKLVSSLEDGEVIYAATYSGNVITIDNTWKPQKLKTYLTPDAGDSYEE